MSHKLTEFSARNSIEHWNTIEHLTLSCPPPSSSHHLDPAVCDIFWQRINGVSCSQSMQRDYATHKKFSHKFDSVKRNIENEMFFKDLHIRFWMWTVKSWQNYLSLHPLPTPLGIKYSQIARVKLPHVSSLAAAPRGGSSIGSGLLCSLRECKQVLKNCSSDLQWRRNMRWLLNRKESTFSETLRSWGICSKKYILTWLSFEGIPPGCVSATNTVWTKTCYLQVKQL